MTREEIVLEVYNSMELKAYSRSINNDLWQDAIQYLIVYYMEIPIAKLMDIYRAGKIMNCSKRILKLSLTSKTSDFYITYNPRKESPIQIESKWELREDMHNAIDDIYQSTMKTGRYPIEMALIKAWMEKGKSINKLSKEIGVPKTFVYNTINSAIEKIKQRVR